MMHGRGVRGAAALAGVDWQGEPTPRPDGSLFSISQATALSQEGEASRFSSREKREPKLKAWEAPGSAPLFGSASLNYHICSSFNCLVFAGTQKCFLPRK